MQAASRWSLKSDRRLDRLAENALNLQHQVAKVERLWKHLSMRDLAAGSQGHGGKAGNEHDLGFGRDFGAVLGEFDAVHFGHDNVRKEQVEALRAQMGNRLRAAIDCDHIIPCTGVWTEELNPEIRLSPSRGTHLIVPAERLGHPTACMTVAIPEEFGRFVFAIPQPDGLCYVGLTDLATDSLQPDPPEPTADELAWLRERISAALAIPLREEDVIAT